MRLLLLGVEMLLGGDAPTQTSKRSVQGEQKQQAPHPTDAGRLNAWCCGLPPPARVLQGTAVCRSVAEFTVVGLVKFRAISSTEIEPPESYSTTAP